MLRLIGVTPTSEATYQYAIRTELPSAPALKASSEAAKVSLPSRHM
jgi:hypothetical protein